MATITSVILSDTFNTLMTRVNSIISKLNTITADASTMTFSFSSSIPNDASLSSSTAVLFVDSSGNLKIKKNVGGTITTHAVTIGSDTGE